METEFITITEYCINYHIDPSFMVSLEESDIVRFPVVEKEKCIHTDQLAELDKYVHLHYDLQINIEGIDAIRHLLQRVHDMQEEIKELQHELHLHK
ncbi:chaperone modulator CbpM [Pedobacter sp. PLR]|uniref:chaperone modulator CbpM n=1 Tax=Pedobacter sp. PLR TaxID=2994465 RepID=UPI002247128A|nr:chaperone modulator CbpM [Pedobacter sp. PLR]MCX2450275.1 chaperone modulator CbpM [Pedobacter sp. PLR]